MEGEATTSEGSYADFDPRSPLRSYLRVVRNIIVEPESFFRAVRGGSLWGPTLFMFTTYLLVSVLSVFLVLPVLIVLIPATVRENPELGGRNFLVFTLLVMAVFILTPFAGVLGTFVGALIWHPFVALFVGVGCGSGFRETDRIGAYQSVLYVSGNFVPIIGPVLALGAMSYVGVLGVKGAHETSTARAGVAIVVPFALTFLLFVAALVLANDVSP